MAKRETDIVLRLTWDDEQQDHPAGWDYRTLLWGDPFTKRGTYEVRLLAVEDVNDGGIQRGEVHPKEIP